MKWIWSFAIVIAAGLSAAAAQSGKDTGMAAMNDDMAKTTYTGCVESVNHGGTFMLTRIDASPMAGMNDSGAMSGQEGTDMKEAVVLSGRSDLKKHVGQRVSVTGSRSKGAADSMRQDVETLTVTALKVIAKSCS